MVGTLSAEHLRTFKHENENFELITIVNNTSAHRMVMWKLAIRVAFVQSMSLQVPESISLGMRGRYNVVAQGPQTNLNRFAGSRMCRALETGAGDIACSEG